MEVMMAKCMKAGFIPAILLILFTILISGCAGGQTLATQPPVNTEDLLVTAGFQRWEVNMETPKRQALLDALPKGKIVTYERNGEVLHAYGNDRTNTLLVGNEAAYQKYLSLAQGKEMCERVAGANAVEFWSCMQEPQGKGARPRGK
jgi:hypothetical protein